MPLFAVRAAGLELCSRTQRGKPARREVLRKLHSFSVYVRSAYVRVRSAQGPDVESNVYV